MTGAVAPGDWGRYDEIIDVRSPDEYRIDHVPGAVNLPVLDDAERSEIGIMHKESAFGARRKGASLVARNVARHLEGALSDRPSGWCPLVYCWRGGQRSRSFAHILREIGWRADQLEGGYKRYRRWVMDRLEEITPELPLRVLAGRTGAGKTMVLRKLGELGAAIIDLEGLAVHRGSVFGVVGEQPSQRKFESGLCACMEAVRGAPVVFVESESRKVGSVHVPGILLARMREAPVIRLEAPASIRARHIIGEYGNYVESSTLFENTLEQIVRYAGKRKVAEWTALHAAGRFGELVERMLEEFYDIGYGRSLERNYGRGDLVATVGLDPCDPGSVARAAHESLAAAV